MEACEVQLDTHVRRCLRASHPHLIRLKESKESCSPIIFQNPFILLITHRIVVDFHVKSFS